MKTEPKINTDSKDAPNAKVPKDVEEPKVGKVCKACGTPTVPVCPKCRRILPKNFEKYDLNLRISVVGATNVGKSTFITRLVETLHFGSKPIPLYVNNIHSETFDKFKKAHSEFVDKGIRSTSVDVIENEVEPQLWELCFERDNKKYRGLLALLDTPGEMLKSPKKNHKTVRQFIHRSNAVFYMVDVDKLNVSTSNGFTDLIEQLNSLDTASLGNLKHKVAVILAKYDAFKNSEELGDRVKGASSFTAEGYDDQDGQEVDDELRRWLESEGKLRYFAPVLNAFQPRNVRFFAVSSCGGTKESKESAHRILDPLLWTLSKIKIVPVKKKNKVFVKQKLTTLRSKLELAANSAEARKLRQGVVELTTNVKRLIPSDKEALRSTLRRIIESKSARKIRQIGAERTERLKRTIPFDVDSADSEKKSNDAKSRLFDDGSLVDE